MKVRFYIEKRLDGEGNLLTRERPVFMSVSFNGKRLLISCGKKIDLHWWDPGIQRIRDEFPEAAVINQWLNGMQDAAHMAWKSVGQAEEPSTGAFREAYEKCKPQFSNGFFEVFYLFMEEGSRRWNRSTYSKVRTIYNHLKEFETRNQTVLSFKGMDASFLLRFEKYYHERGNNQVTTLKAVNTIVWFLNWASRKRFNIYTDYKSFYRSLDPVDQGHRNPMVFLEWEELIHLYEYPFKEPKMQRARDLFCFMCLTGLRYTEVREFRRDHVMEGQIIVNKRSSKTRVVPLNNFSAGILKRYENKYYSNNSALPVMSLVTLNKYIGLILDKAKISKNSSEFKAGAAVATFLANALILGIPAEVISSYTGISNDRRIKLLKQQLAMQEMKKFNRT